MLSLVLAAALANLPATQDQEPPGAALSGPSSSRLALPVTIRFDESLTNDVTPLVKKNSGDSESSSREPVASVAHFAPAVARRHFEDAKWGDKTAERSVVVKSISVAYSDGPSYEVKVVVDRYEGDHRLGQATGSGWAHADRTAQRTGAAFSGPAAFFINKNANEAKPEDDVGVIRQATVAALDNALRQLSAVWLGEQLTAKARADAEAMMQKARDDAAAANKKKK